MAVCKGRLARLTCDGILTPPPPDRQPGWRTDPWFTGQYRWWDGSTWSGDVFPEGVGPYGRGTVVTERPPAERPPVPAPWQPAFPAPPPPAWVIGRLEQAPPPPLPVETIESAPPRRRLSTTAILALLLVFGIALGTTIGLLTAHLVQAPGGTRPTPPSNPPSRRPTPAVRVLRTPSPAAPSGSTSGCCNASACVSPTCRAASSWP